MHEALLHPVMIHKGTPTLSNQNKFRKILSLYLRKKRKQNLPVQTFAIYLFKSSLYSCWCLKCQKWPLSLEFVFFVYFQNIFILRESWRLKNSLSPDLQDITETLTFRLNQPRMPAVNKHVQQDGSRFGEFLRPTSTRTSHLCLRLSSNLNVTYFGLNNTCGK